MARTKQVQAVKVKNLTLSQPKQKFTTMKTSIPSVKMGSSMVNAIKQSPKGVLPNVIAKLLKGV